MKNIKCVVDPRILVNMLTSGYFPHIESWEVALLRFHNGEDTPLHLPLYIFIRSMGKCLTQKSKRRMELLWRLVTEACNEFNHKFGMDPRDPDRTYEEMLNHAQTILNRLALTIVEQEEMLKSMRLAPHSEVTVAYRSQFRSTYNCAARLFGEDLCDRQAYKPFFTRAEKIVADRKK